MNNYCAIDFINHGGWFIQFEIKQLIVNKGSMRGIIKVV
jgi:hypothetical protein